MFATGSNALGLARLLTTTSESDASTNASDNVVTHDSERVEYTEDMSSDNGESDDDEDDEEEEDDVAYSDDETLTREDMLHYDDNPPDDDDDAWDLRKDEESDMVIVLDYVQELEISISTKHVPGPYKTFTDFVDVPQIMENPQNLNHGLLVAAILSKAPTPDKLERYRNYIQSLDSYGALEALRALYRERQKDWIPTRATDASLKKANRDAGLIYSRRMLDQLRAFVIAKCIQEDTLSILPTHGNMFFGLGYDDSNPTQDNPFVQVAKSHVNVSTASRFSVSIVDALRALQQIPRCDSDVRFLSVARAFLTAVFHDAIQSLGAQLGGMETFFRMVTFVLYGDLRPYDNDDDAFRAECASLDECKMRLKHRLAKQDNKSRNAMNYVHGCKARADATKLSNKTRFALACEIVCIAFKCTTLGFFAHPPLLYHTTHDAHQAIVCMLLCGVNQEVLSSFVECWEEELSNNNDNDSVRSDHGDNQDDVKNGILTARLLNMFLAHIIEWSDLNASQVDAIDCYFDQPIAAFLLHAANESIGSNLVELVNAIPERTILRTTLDRHIQDLRAAVEKRAERPQSTDEADEPLYPRKPENITALLVAWKTQTIATCDDGISAIRAFVDRPIAEPIDNLHASFLCALADHRPTRLVLPQALAKRFVQCLHARAPADARKMNFVERMMRTAERTLMRTYFDASEIEK